MIVCSPPLIIYKFQAWRLLTGLFCHPQFMTLLFALFSWVSHGIRGEQTIGTVRYFFRFWMTGFFTLPV